MPCKAGFGWILGGKVFPSVGRVLESRLGISRLLNLIYAYMIAGDYFFKNPEPPLTWDFFETYYLPPLHNQQFYKSNITRGKTKA